MGIEIPKMFDVIKKNCSMDGLNLYQARVYRKVPDFYKLIINQTKNVIFIPSSLDI